MKGDPVALHLGDAKTVLPTISESSIDSIVTDPPYELGFMGKKWDSSGIANDISLWRECHRVLKPGGHLLSFGGSRTFHRMACAIEDAGFEIRDQIMWLYGSGFPKSHNLSGEWKGWGTALKPAHEPIVVARKPLVGTVANNIDRFATGAINIDGCRVPIEADDNIFAKNPHTHGGFGHADAKVYGEGKGSDYRPGQGRWPSNVIHDGSEEVLAGFPHTTSGKPSGTRNTNSNMFASGGKGVRLSGFGDAGSAARFFYCAKAKAKERGEDNTHPTVKPTDLMRYLCRLVTPPGGVVLDPFMGSGSTGKAALKEGFRFIGIEREPEYFSIAEARIAAASEQPEMILPMPEPKPIADREADLFGNSAA